MRTTAADAAVRLYHLDEQDGTPRTLLYGSLADALAAARAEPEAVQAGLWLQTRDDVVSFLDLEEG